MLIMNIEAKDSKDRYTQMGGYAVHKHKLYFKCQLQLKYWKSRGVINCMPKAFDISFDLQQIIIHILENNCIGDDLLSELSFSDTILMETVLHKAKIIETLGYKRPKSVIIIEQIRHRLFILQGSIGAGNEGREIYKECLELVEKLHTMDDLSNYDYFTLKKVLKSV